MATKDLFRIVLRSFGLYFLATVIFNYLPSIMVLFNTMPLLSLILSVVVLLLFASIFVQLIFKPDPIISLLKLDKGFDNELLSVKEFKLINLLNRYRVTFNRTPAAHSSEQPPLSVYELFCHSLVYH
jgi:cellulose synthase/poly-beta-1,6-N-acetylglucosamine synthase-like glycosyltransferase